jgi:cell fate regulator YaaT (PSP1 superfamily)
LVGSRDVAFFNVSDNFTLDQNDYVFWEAANASSTSNITLEQGGFTFVSAR